MVNAAIALRFSRKLQSLSAIVLLITNCHTASRLDLYQLVGLVVKASASRAEIQGLNPAYNRIFLGQVIPVTSKLALQWLPCQAPGVIGSAQELVGLVSVYCDWVR